MTFQYGRYVGRQGINNKLTFGGGHEHAQESIFERLEQLLRGCITANEITDNDPLNIFVHEGADSALGFYSRQNRRLMALVMLQVTRREELIVA